MFMRFRWRLFVYLMMALYFYQDAAKDTGIYGMFLSDLSYEVSFQEFIMKWKWPRRVAALLTVTGLLVCSYPGKHPQWCTWSNAMLEAAQYIFPPNVNIGKRYSAIGVDCIIFAIYISPSVKDFLSNRLLLWLGKQSFAVYLVHGTLLRTVLCWMLYGITGQPFDPNNLQKNKEGKDERVWIPIRLPWVVAISIRALIVLVYFCATMWTKYVDPFCAKLTQKMENRMFIQEEKLAPQAEESLPLTSLPMTAIPMQQS
ncbi:hypothetical protein BDV06DRAFT_228466 [Aspergillus oleicola]